MKSFAEMMVEDQRLVILRVLSDLPGYCANSSILAAGMTQMGHQISRDQVKTHMRWLQEQQLLSVEEPVQGVLVAKLTERGHDVANGLAVVPGVKRPGA